MKLKKETSLFFRILKWFVRLFYGRMEIEGLENLPEKNAVLVGNHSQMDGPIAGELFLPENCYTWCAGQMMKLKEVPQYAFTDFWSQKPKWTHPFYKLLSYIIAPLAVLVFNDARTIAVYRDMRVMSTFKTSIKMLQEGKNLLIFPEKDERYNNILYRFQENFVDVARLYEKKTQEAVTFVPVYIAPKLRKIYIGKGIVYDSKNEAQEERKRITAYLSDEITDMARKLPCHTVVPYRNIPHKYYITNKDTERLPGDQMEASPAKKSSRQPVVDYREFRLSRLGEPQYNHLLYLIGWIGYFIAYFLTENLIPWEKCYPVHCFLDDVIPFCEYFVIPYVGWYVLIAASLLYFALYHPEFFKSLMKFIITTQICAMAIYIIFPNRQDLRPTEFVRDNIFTDIVGLLYKADTSTNVCPSLHVAYSVGIASTWLKEKRASVRCKTLITAFCLLICISVAFVKQHSVVDMVVALPICVLAEWIAFGKTYYTNTTR